MRKNDNAFPHFSSIDELVAYVDAHDVGDELDAMPEAHFDVELRTREHVVTLDGDLAEQIEKIADMEHVPSQRLINTWLRERLTHLHAA